MNKKLLYLVASGTITLGSICCVVAVDVNNYKLLKELDNNKTKLELILNELDELKDSKAELIQEKEIIKATNEKLHKQIDELKDKLDEVIPTKVELLHFNEYDLTELSNANVSRLNEMIKDTKLKGLGASYKQAEEEYGVNAIFLIALTAQESGWGTSRRAIEDNNLSGFEVYTPQSKGATFDSKHDSIMTTGRLLGTEYLSKDGKYFKGKDIYTVNETYCPVDGHAWANNIVKIAKELIKG